MGAPLMELDWMHYLLIALLLLTILSAAWLISKSVQHKRELHTLYWNALVALSRAVRAIDDFALEEHRTADSMSSGAFLSAAGNAKLRGLEVYRNGYVEQKANAIRAHLASYNEVTEALLKEMDWNPDDFRSRGEELTGKKLAVANLHGTPAGKNRPKKSAVTGHRSTMTPAEERRQLLQAQYDANRSMDLFGLLFFVSMLFLCAGAMVLIVLLR